MVEVYLASNAACNAHLVYHDEDVKLCAEFAGFRAFQAAKHAA